jgi:predicted negative regulator of RcsB-dependent stress response
MSRLITLIVLVIVVIACVGFYMDWFHLSTTGNENKKDITLSVDQTKIRADAQKAEEKIKNLEQKAKEKISAPSTKSKSPQP